MNTTNCFFFVNILIKVVEPVNPRVNQDAPLELNCTLTKFNKTLFDSASMYFVNVKYGRTDRRIPTEFYSRPNDRTLRMIVPAVSSDDNVSQFRCYVNRSAAGESDEYIDHIEVFIKGGYTYRFIKNRAVV